VINLQTNFGGGQDAFDAGVVARRSRPSDRRIPAGHAGSVVGQQVQRRKVNRVAIVGNHFSPSGVIEQDGTHVNTMWGELAWQLGGPQGYAFVANADANRTPPGDALQKLFGGICASGHLNR